MVRRTLATLVTLAALAPTPGAAEADRDPIRERDDRIEELERKVDLLAGELARELPRRDLLFDSIERQREGMHLVVVE